MPAGGGRQGPLCVVQVCRRGCAADGPAAVRFSLDGKRRFAKGGGPHHYRGRGGAHGFGSPAGGAGGAGVGRAPGRTGAAAGFNVFLSEGAAGRIGEHLSEAGVLPSKREEHSGGGVFSAGEGERVSDSDAAGNERADEDSGSGMPGADSGDGTVFFGGGVQRGGLLLGAEHRGDEEFRVVHLHGGGRYAGVFSEDVAGGAGTGRGDSECGAAGTRDFGGAVSAEHSAKAEHNAGRVQSTSQRRSTRQAKCSAPRHSKGDAMLKEVTEKYSRELDGFIRELRKKLSQSEVAEDAERLLKYVEDEFFGSELAGRVEYWEICDMVRAVYLRLRSKYGILQEYLEDPAINEIMVNGPEHIFVEKNRKVQAVDNAFISAEELEGVIRMLASDVHREINEANPIVDARMPSGYRINGVLRNVALNGPALTIRKFAESMITMEELVQRKSLTEECKEDLCALTECGYNIFISGGTSSGKTTMLNALASYIHPEERVVIIEDSAELQLNHLENRVQMECRSANSIGKGEVRMDQLIRTSLRMRPDRIIVGEVRGGEVLDMIQAIICTI